ncbi:hypothetical protein NEIPOLOT_01381 [Neisseria polysaccharea ATCC 43768]|nr:hypothetical protein NEIPOLOT_01381 [Neisseria polysaccharea ATCC 43768]
MIYPKQQPSFRRHSHAGGNPVTKNHRKLSETQKTETERTRFPLARE